MKTCTRCGDTKPLDQYGNQAAKPDGKQPHCKACASIDAAAKYLKNGAHIRAKVKANQDGKLSAERLATRAARIDARAAGEKHCKICGETKPLDQFGKRATLESGRRNVCKSCRSDYERGYRQDNNAAVCAYHGAHTAKYRAQRLNATPAWHETDAVTALYLDSASRAAPHHVDHVIPLQHPLVCGLHCLANLQVIPARENQQKNNTFNL